MDDELLGSWVKKASEGAPDALQRLLVHHHTGLLSFISILLPHDLESKLSPDDILQDIYIKVYRDLGEADFVDPPSFTAWLQTMAQRSLDDAIEAIRIKKLGPGWKPAAKSAVGTTYTDLAARLGDAPRSPSSVAACNEAKANIMAALARLQGDYRRAIQLHFIEGRSANEVALLMGKSKPTVRSLCIRGMRELRMQLRQTSLFFSRE